jgi:serine/threonine protein kinase
MENPMQGIADYEFIRSLGWGNHGQYFLARRPARLPVAAEYVAVKVLGAEASADAFRRATREMRAFAAVRSPYLVTLYDAGQQDGVYYYSMEYLPDGSLAEPARPLDRAQSLRAVTDAARAAADLHDAGIVHRDIKPSNILLTAAGGARLSDLGLSQTIAPGMTVTGMGSMSSVEYTDPDLLHGEPPATHHDVWSLGTVLHRVLSGSGVYGELPPTDALLALRRILSSEPTISPALPPALADVVRACLAPPAERISARALADWLAGTSV